MSFASSFASIFATQLVLSRFRRPEEPRKTRFPVDASRSTLDTAYEAGVPSGYTIEVQMRVSASGIREQVCVAVEAAS